MRDCHVYKDNTVMYIAIFSVGLKNQSSKTKKGKKNISGKTLHYKSRSDIQLTSML